MERKKETSRALFDTAHLDAQLRMHGVRGAVATVLSQALRFCIQICGTVILARLLLPSEFGVIGKTLAITGFITVIGTGGLSLATIQRSDVTADQISNLFWLNVLLGVAGALLIAGISPIMAWFYRDARVLDVGFALAGLVVITALSVQHSAIMQRQMRFRKLASINIIAMLVGVLAAVLAALLGASYWSLIIRQYAFGLTFLLLVLDACRWWPARPSANANVAPMIKIGANQTGFNFLNFASRNVDNVLIGRFVSDAALGYYTQAYSLLLLPVSKLNAPISAVAVSTLSKLQGQPARYARYYYRALGLIVLVGMPLICFLLADAPLVVSAVLGPRWAPTVPIFRALGVAAFFGTFNFAGGWVYASLGRTERRLKWQLLVTTLTLLAFALGVNWGVMGVAVAFSCLQPVLLVPSLRYCYKGTPIRVKSTLATLARPAASAVGALAALVLAHNWIRPETAYWIPLDLLFFAVIYVAAWCVTPGGRHHLRSIGDVFSELRRP